MKKNTFIFRLLPLLFLLLLILLQFGQTLIPSEGKMIYGGDLLTQFYFWKGYLASNVRSGVIPFWSPYNFSGMPFLAHPSTAAFYPLTLLFVLLPLNIAFSINYAIHILIAGLGMYLLLRSYKTDELSALAASAAFMLSGFIGARVYAGHVDIISTAVWIPWVLWSARQLLSEPSKKNFLLLVASTSLEILASYTAIVLFTVEVVTAYLAFTFVIDLWLYRRIKISKFLLVFLSFTIAAALTAIQWYPTLQFINLSIRGGGLPYSMVSWGSFPPSALKLFVDPYNVSELAKFPYTFAGFTLPDFFDYYPGRIVLLIAVVFIILKLLKLFTGNIFGKKILSVNHDFWFYLFMICIFIWLATGGELKYSLHHLFYTLIPFYRNIRIPTQHLIMVSFLLPLIFGMAVSSVRSKLFSWLIMIMIVMELLPFSRQFFINTNIPEIKYDQNLVKTLKSTTQITRFLPDFGVISPTEKLLNFNSAEEYAIQSTTGYDPMILRNYFDFIDIANGNRSSSQEYYNVEVPPLSPYSPALDFLNIGFIMTEADRNWQERGRPIKFSTLLSSDKYILYKNNNVLPRFFLVSRFVALSNTAAVKEKLLTAQPDDFRRNVYITKDEQSKLPQKAVYDCGNYPNAGIYDDVYTPGKIVLTMETNCSGILATSEIYYPGWKATIDGRKVPILLINTAFRAIYLPAGKHTVRFYYQPDIYLFGGKLSLLGCAAIVLILAGWSLIPISLRKTRK
ncbi:MAG: YfhO family protein [Patescibacteria group bacterium]|nr:YfhO family protein [Patescibacteria group bacterium]